jgi:hypothetical protein
MNLDFCDVGSLDAVRGIGMDRSGAQWSQAQWSAVGRGGAHWANARVLIALLSENQANNADPWPNHR